MNKNIEKTLIEAERYIHDLLYYQTLLRTSIKDSKMQNYRKYYTLMKKIGHMRRTTEEIYNLFNEMKENIPYYMDCYKQDEKYFYIDYIKSEVNRIKAFYEITKDEIEEDKKKRDDERNKKQIIAYG